MSNKPAATFRIGNVKATVWKNDNFHNVTIARAYKDADGNWKDGDSFGQHDLLNVAKVSERAEQFISEQ